MLLLLKCCWKNSNRTVLAIERRWCALKEVGKAVSALARHLVVWVRHCISDLRLCTDGYDHLDDDVSV